MNKVLFLLCMHITMCIIPSSESDFDMFPARMFPAGEAVYMFFYAPCVFGPKERPVPEFRDYTDSNGSLNIGIESEQAYVCWSRFLDDQGQLRDVDLTDDVGRKVQELKKFFAQASSDCLSDEHIIEDGSQASAVRKEQLALRGVGFLKKDKGLLRQSLRELRQRNKQSLSILLQEIEELKIEYLALSHVLPFLDISDDGSVVLQPMRVETVRASMDRQNSEELKLLLEVIKKKQTEYNRIVAKQRYIFGGLSCFIHEIQDSLDEYCLEQDLLYCLLRKPNTFDAVRRICLYRHDYMYEIYLGSLYTIYKLKLNELEQEHGLYSPEIHQQYKVLLACALREKELKVQESHSATEA